MRIISKVIVLHVGARDSYNISKYFQSKRILTRLFTDFWIKASYLKILPLSFNKKVQRRYSTILKNNVTAYSIIRLLYSLLREKNIKVDFEKWYFHDKNFSNFVKYRIKKNVDMIWGYSNCSLEVFESVNKNVIKVLNQIDPGIKYYEIRDELYRKYPNFEEEQPKLPEYFKNRMIAEWHLADYIVVNSNYSKSCLMAKGVQDSKIVVLPLIYNNVSVYKKENNSRLRIGFVGNINLIKGFKVFQEVAQKLSDKMDFIAVGSVFLNNDIISDISTYIKFLGLVNKDNMSETYKSIDVLLFPSFSDGFGMVQLEAMGYGIPVIASNNCGEVVINGFNGYKTNVPEEIVCFLNELNEDRNKLSTLSKNALSTVNEFSQQKFEEKISMSFKQMGILFKDAK